MGGNVDTLGHTVALQMLREHRERGQRLRQLRNARGLTQREAGDLVDATEKTWGSWEAGSGMKPANVRKVAEAFGVTIEEITGAAELPNPFSLAAHLDENVEVFRAWCEQMSDDFARVEAKLDTLATALVAEGTIQRESWMQGVREAAAILRAAHADGDSRERGTGTHGRD